LPVVALAIETPRTKMFFLVLPTTSHGGKKTLVVNWTTKKNPVACGWRNDILLQMHSNNSSMVRPYPEARKYLHPLGFV
jgi:hypothetical protein